MPKYTVTMTMDFKIDVEAPDEDAAALAAEDVEYDHMRLVAWTVSDIEEVSA